MFAFGNINNNYYSKTLNKGTAANDFLHSKQLCIFSLLWVSICLANLLWDLMDLELWELWTNRSYLPWCPEQTGQDFLYGVMLRYFPFLMIHMFSDCNSHWSITDEIGVTCWLLSFYLVLFLTFMNTTFSWLATTHLNRSTPDNSWPLCNCSEWSGSIKTGPG